MFADWLSKDSPTRELATACHSMLSLIAEFDRQCLDIGDQGRAWLTAAGSLRAWTVPSYTHGLPSVLVFVESYLFWKDPIGSKLHSYSYDFS